MAKVVLRRPVWLLRGLAMAIPVVLAAATIAPAGSEGGTPQWSSVDHAAAFTSDVVTSPDGSTVFVTGSTVAGPASHYVTIAYDSASGAEKWQEEFPSKTNPDFGRAQVLAISADGRRLFVSGYMTCNSGCDSSSFEGSVTVAYDAATGDRLWVSRFPSHGGGPLELAVSPAGTGLFLQAVTGGGSNRSTIAYDPATGQQLWVVDTTTGYGASEGGLQLSPSGAVLYVADTQPPSPVCPHAGGYRTTAYNAGTGALLWVAGFKVTETYQCGTSTDVNVSPNGAMVFVTGYGSPQAGNTYGSATVAYDALTGSQLWASRDADISVLTGDTMVSVGSAPDSSKIFVSGYRCGDAQECRDSTAVTLGIEALTGTRLWKSTYQGGGPVMTTDLAINPDGSSVYITGYETLPCYDPCGSAQQNAPVVAYDAGSGAERWATTYQDNTGMALAVSHDGRSLYLAGTLTEAASTGRAAIDRLGRCTSACGYSTSRINTKSGSGTFQDTAPAVRLDGWRGIFDKDAIAGAYRASRVKGDSAVFRTPRTTSFAWLTQQGPNRGKAKVVVDGRPIGTYDLYAADPSSRVVTFDGLANRKHTVTVKVLGKKRSSSTGRWVTVDAFTFPASDGIVQEDSPAIRFTSWKGATSKSAAHASYRLSGSRGARATLTFKGRTIRWITATGPGYGKARVTIDGRARVVDLYRPKRSLDTALSFTGLGKGRHRISVTVLGTKNAAARTDKVVIDAFVVRR